MNYKALVMFLVIAYVGYWAGGWVIDSFLAALLPFLFTGIVGDVLRFSIPTGLVFFLWLRFGKSG